MPLCCQDHTLTENKQIQLLTMGLGDPLRMGVALQWPTIMDEAVMYAHAYEQ
jgi:hypothetical protein